MTTLLYNIGHLYQTYEKAPPLLRGKEMSKVPFIKNAYLSINNGLIEDFGSMTELKSFPFDQSVDLSHKSILPAWCDSHTHLVYAKDRADEFVHRIQGLTYQEIAAKGGGILNSAKTLRETSEEALFESAKLRLNKLIEMGTGAIEIKSGYGLVLDSEIKMLQVIQRLKSHFSLPIKATFLAAHAVPNEFSNTEDYVTHIVEVMLPVVAEKGLADYIDVFCEKGYFDVNQMERILKAGAQYGLKPKVHVNQFNSIGGIKAAVRQNAVSVDHLEVLTPDDLDQLKQSNTIPVALPACSFFLGIPYTPGRLIIDNDLPLALASDFNPGSAPSGNLNLVLSLACIKMKLTPEEAINALTINGALAMGLEHTHGTITRGKKANLIVTECIDSLADLAYYFGEIKIADVYISGISTNNSKA